MVAPIGVKAQNYVLLNLGLNYALRRQLPLGRKGAAFTIRKGIIPLTFTREAFTLHLSLQER